MRRMLCLTAFALLLVPALAAADPGPWLGVEGTWGTYEMDHFNQSLDLIGASRSSDTGLPTDPNKIDNRFGYGAVIAGDPRPGFELGLRYERTSTTGKVEDATGWWTRWHQPADMFTAFGSFQAPVAGPVAVRFGLAAGWLSSRGKFTESEPGFVTVTNHVTGSGPVGEAFAGADHWFTPTWGWYGTAGYRLARAWHYEVEGDRTDRTLDYSGVVIRAGLRLALVR